MGFFSKKGQKKVVNLPSVHLNVQPLTRAAMEKQVGQHVSSIANELLRGMRFIRTYPRSVTFFGSARFPESNEYYQKAQRLGALLAQEGFAVVTGGGPGIMEAANRGAMEAKGSSIGFNISLPKEQVINPYVDGHVEFDHFFTRKVALAFSAEAYLFFPGGFGTMDEFFEIITLVQTHKIERVPIILVGKDFWQPLQHFMENLLCNRHNTIVQEDLSLYTITDDEDEIVSIVKNAPLRIE